MTAPQDLYQAAEHALKHAYVKYSNFPVAACLRSDDGRLFAGANVENAAYGLSLCAEASALGAMVSAGAKCIVEVLVLVPHDLLCPPCGSCRQRLYEFADPSVIVHLCTTGGEYKKLTIGELLPFAFGSSNLA